MPEINESYSDYKARLDREMEEKQDMYKSILDILTNDSMSRWSINNKYLIKDKPLNEYLNKQYDHDYVKMIIYALQNQKNYMIMIKSIRNIPNIEGLIKKYND